MEEELKDLVEEDWDWRVQKINRSDFSMFFPSKESLRMAIRGGGLTLPSSKLHVIVTSNAGDPAAAEQLEECWIKLFDVPPLTCRRCGFSWRPGNWVAPLLWMLNRLNLCWTRCG
jgi:hypothetical protein